MSYQIRPKQPKQPMSHQQRATRAYDWFSLLLGCDLTMISDRIGTVSTLLTIDLPTEYVMNSERWMMNDLIGWRWTVVDNLIESFHTRSLFKTRSRNNTAEYLHIHTLGQLPRIGSDSIPYPILTPNPGPGRICLSICPFNEIIISRILELLELLELIGLR